MIIKRSFFPSHPLYTLFVLNVFQVNTSSLNSGQSFSTEESRQFDSSEDTNESQVKITFSNLEKVYSIDDEYTFFIPKVRTECECSCTMKYELYCSDKTPGYSRECADLMNSTTTCTVYNSFGEDTSVCRKYYRMCCRIFFSKMNLINSFKAFHLKFQKSIFKIQVYLKSTLAKENVSVFIPPDVKYLQFISENLLHTFYLKSLFRLPDDWYFVPKESLELLFTEHLNEVDGYNLDKMGWFQFRERKNALLPVHSIDLKERLQVKPSNCHSLPPKYEWKLNAEGFYKKGLLKLPKDTRNVIEIYENSVKNISLNLKEKTIIIEAKESPNVNVSVVSIESLPFFFFSNISVISDKRPVLNLKFTKGNGSIIIEIANPSWKNTLMFSKFISNASGDSPFITSYGLPFTKTELFLVCASQGEQQLCQSPTTIREIKTTFKEPTENTTLHFPSTIGKGNATNDYEEDGQQEQEQRPFSRSKIMAIICLCGIFPTLMIIVILYLQLRKQKKRSNDCEMEMCEQISDI